MDRQLLAVKFMKTTSVLGLICIAGLTAQLPAAAGDNHGKRDREESRENGDSQGDRNERRGGGQREFSAEERDTIHGYVGQFGKQEGKHPRSLPPGLAKKIARGGGLPPGWEHKCVTGQQMPPEVYQACRPLPRELEVKLPVPPVGTVTVAVGGKVVRLLEATRQILDVFDVHVNF